MLRQNKFNPPRELMGGSCIKKYQSASLLDTSHECLNVWVGKKHLSSSLSCLIKC